MAKSIASGAEEYPPSLGGSVTGLEPGVDTREGWRRGPPRGDEQPDARDQWASLLTAKHRDKLRQRDGELQAQLDQAVLEGQVLRARLQNLTREVGVLEKDLCDLKEVVRVEREAARGKERLNSAAKSLSTIPSSGPSPAALMALSSSPNWNILPPYLWGVLSLYMEIHPQAITPDTAPVQLQYQHKQ